MSEFAPAYDCMIRHEVRNYGTPHQISYSDDPDDAGGETHWGVSLKVIVQNYHLNPEDLKLPNFDKGCMRDLLEDIAKEVVYRPHFWDSGKYKDIIVQDVASKTFDAAVNMGPHNAVECLQKAVVLLGNKIDIDGSLGPITLAAVNDLDHQYLLKTMCATLTDYYNANVARIPKNAKFLKGWLIRASWIHP